MFFLFPKAVPPFFLSSLSSGNLDIPRDCQPCIYEIDEDDHGQQDSPGHKIFRSFFHTGRRTAPSLPLRKPSAGKRLLLSIMFLFFLYACAHPDVTVGNADSGRSPQEVIKGKPGDPARGSDKVSAHIRAVINEMEKRGITRQNARELGASSFSNPLVQVNEEGDIQTYIYVSTLGKEEKALLENYEVTIEIANKEFGIIQAWIPFSRIEEVARFPFVRRIAPPGYGTLREGNVKKEGSPILTTDEMQEPGLDSSTTKSPTNR